MGDMSFVGSAVCRGLELRGSSGLRAVRRHTMQGGAAVVVGDIDMRERTGQRR